MKTRMTLTLATMVVTALTGCFNSSKNDNFPQPALNSNKVATFADKHEALNRTTVVDEALMEALMGPQSSGCLVKVKTFDKANSFGVRYQEYSTYGNDVFPCEGRISKFTANVLRLNPNQNAEDIQLSYYSLTPQNTIEINLSSTMKSMSHPLNPATCERTSQVYYGGSISNLDQKKTIGFRVLKAVNIQEDTQDENDKCLNMPLTMTQSSKVDTYVFDDLGVELVRKTKVISGGKNAGSKVEFFINGKIVLEDEMDQLKSGVQKLPPLPPPPPPPAEPTPTPTPTPTATPTPTPTPEVPPGSEIPGKMPNE